MSCQLNGIIKVRISFPIHPCDFYYILQYYKRLVYNEIKLWSNISYPLYSFSSVLFVCLLVCGLIYIDLYLYFIYYSSCIFNICLLSLYMLSFSIIPNILYIIINHLSHDLKIFQYSWLGKNCWYDISNPILYIFLFEISFSYDIFLPSIIYIALSVWNI